MNTTIKTRLQKIIRNFELPTYQDIPELGLYLDQTVQYINGYLHPFPGMEITSSMISNYVKKGMIERPTKKLYSREQIAYLIFITVGKTVLSLEHINMLFQMQRKVYDSETAYTYFRLEFKNVLEYIFELKPTLEKVGSDISDEKVMLRNTIFTVSNKLYLEKVFEEIQNFQNQEL